jgi:hypothetical protein
LRPFGKPPESFVDAFGSYFRLAAIVFLSYSAARTYFFEPRSEYHNQDTVSKEFI